MCDEQCSMILARFHDPRRCKNKATKDNFCKVHYFEGKKKELQAILVKAIDDYEKRKNINTHDLITELDLDIAQADVVKYYLTGALNESKAMIRITANRINSLISDMHAGLI